MRGEKCPARSENTHFRKLPKSTDLWLFRLSLTNGGRLFADRGNDYSYGWRFDDEYADANAKRRYDIVDCRLDGHVRGNDNTWKIALINGDYLVNVTVGDISNPDESFSFSMEGVDHIDPDLTKHPFHALENVPVTITDGFLSIYDLVGTGTDYQFKIDFVEIVDAATRFNLQLSEATIVQAAATIYSGYVTGDRVPVSQEREWLKRWIKEAVQLARWTDDAVQADDELD